MRTTEIGKSLVGRPAEISAITEILSTLPSGRGQVLLLAGEPGIGKSSLARICNSTPESHSVHHAKGIHGFNYSDLPFWGIIFGAFHSPAAIQREHGFYPGASERIPEMLIGRDVTSPGNVTTSRGENANLKIDGELS